MMMQFKSIYYMLTVAGLAVASQTVSAQIEPGLNTDLALEHDGIVRNYDLLVPAQTTSPPAVIIDMHGTFGSSNGQRSISGFDSLVEQEQLVIIYPDSTGNEWTVYGFGNGADDSGFLRALVNAVDEEIDIDNSRVYATGHSNGGTMAQSLICNSADVFAAIVSFDAPIPASVLPPCTLDSAVPLMLVRSRVDELIPFNGGMTESVDGQSVEVLSAEDERDVWAASNSCQGTQPDSFTQPGTNTACSEYTVCADGSRVKMCATESTGSFGHFSYQNIDEVNFAAMAWDFMNDFSLAQDDGDGSTFTISSDIEGNWVNPDPEFANSRQGMMFDFGPSLNQLFMAWFTYTSIPEMPPEAAMDIGSEDQRWFTALLDIDGNTATGTMQFSAGGEFNAPAPPFLETRQAGTISIEFTACDEALVMYEFDEPALSGTFSIIPLEQAVNPVGFDCGP